MYNREKIEEALEALSLGFSSSQAAELDGRRPVDRRALVEGQAAAQLGRPGRQNRGDRPSRRGGAHD